MKNSGFTIIELLVVIAVAGILLAGSVVSLSSLRASSNLTAGADTIRLTLEKSRLSALVKENGTGYSLKFNENNLTLFKGAVYDPGDSANKIISLPFGTKITSLNLGTGSDVVSFSSLVGTTSPGTIVLSSVNDPSKTKTIYIDGSGRVYNAYMAGGGGSSSGGSGGGQGQVIDSGRQEFNLGWSIQDTSELKFKFLTDPPETKVFIMQPHFNGNHTVFNYVGYFSEGGVAQKITMYSSQLDPQNTVMSIIREPAASGPTLEISIDNRVIVTYLADGTVSVGSGGGMMITQ